MICKKCNNEFEPLYFNGILRSKFCIPCLSIKGKSKLKTINNKEKSIAKDKLKTHKDYLKDLQFQVNKFIRLRDKDLPCISCGTFKCEEFHAGHYIATTHQYLRFNELNINKQCSYCNTHLRGNLIPYRIELIKRIGLDKIEWLENNIHNDLKLTIPEIKEQIEIYKNKVKTTTNII